MASLYNRKKYEYLVGFQSLKDIYLAIMTLMRI